MIKDNNLFEKGKGDWDKLLAFMDDNPFSISDMLAVICANLVKEKEKNFCTTLMVGGENFFVQIKKGYK